MEQILLVVGITCFVMISPGPDMILVLRNTVVGGRSAGLETSIGVLAGNLVHIGYCALGVGWLISQSILAFSLFKFAGAAYLVYLGIQSFRVSHVPLRADPSEPPRREKAWLVQGFLNNILNPKGTLFYLGVFTTVITRETSLGMSLTLILSMMGVSAAFWVVFVYTLDRPSLRLLLESGQQTVQRIFGVLLVGLGIRVATLER
jgi:threonine/homoserine/homoserine lactone efflux protein